MELKLTSKPTNVALEWVFYPVAPGGERLPPRRWHTDFHSECLEADMMMYISVCVNVCVCVCVCVDDGDHSSAPGRGHFNASMWPARVSLLMDEPVGPLGDVDWC